MWRLMHQFTKNSIKLQIIWGYNYFDNKLKYLIYKINNYCFFNTHWLVYYFSIILIFPFNKKQLTKTINKKINNLTNNELTEFTLTKNWKQLNTQFINFNFII